MQDAEKLIREEPFKQSANSSNQRAEEKLAGKKAWRSYPQTINSVRTHEQNVKKANQFSNTEFALAYKNKTIYLHWNWQSFPATKAHGFFKAASTKHWENNQAIQQVDDSKLAKFKQIEQNDQLDLSNETMEARSEPGQPTKRRMTDVALDLTLNSHNNKC